MIYVNFDLETTGLLADTAAILSLGAVATDSATDWKAAGEFSHNLKIPENRGWETDYKAWWDEQPREIFEANTKNPSDPWWVMSAFLDWIDHLSQGAAGEDKRVAFVANPIAYDLPLLRSYMVQFVPARWAKFGNDFKSTLGGIDLPTLAMTVMGADTRQDRVEYPDARRSKWPERWTPKNLPLNHIAIDDARLQSYAFVQMMRELDEVRGRRPF